MVAGQRVLVVDDNSENRALAKATLEDDGYEVILAHDGRAGIAAFEAHQPECILLDIQMPDLSGIEVCERIRALPGGEVVAIIFVTAQRDITVFDRALAARGDDFLTKPFRPSELVVRVQTAMRLRRLSGERSELYAEVKRQRDDLQRLQLHKDQVTAFLVHDFKNPVNSIALQTERMLRDPAGSDRSRSAATAIRNETRALMRMILNLLDLSRSDEGRLVPARETIDIAAQLAAIVDEHRPVAAASSVELATAVETPVVVADSSLLQRVLANLVENAIRHSPEGGVVTIEVVRVAAAVELRVSDQGTGVPEALRAQVFHRFQTDGGRQNRGLGLTFCKVAVQAHGGDIWIEDARPGAMFCVRIPDAG